MKQGTKEWIQYGICILCVVGAMVMSFIAMYIEPSGVIDNSILWLIAQVLVFCGSILGLANYVGSNTNITKRIDDLERKLFKVDKDSN